MQSPAAGRDNVGTHVALTTIAFATPADLRSQNRRPGVSPYPHGIAVDSARAVPRELFLHHGSRKLCVLSRKLCIALRLCDRERERRRECPYSRGYSSPRYLRANSAERSRETFRRLASPSACARPTLITANAINQPCERVQEGGCGNGPENRQTRSYADFQGAYTHAVLLSRRLSQVANSRSRARDSDLFYASPVQRSEAIIA